MLWRCCTQYASKFGKLSWGHRTEKGQFSFQSPKKAMPKNAQTVFTKGRGTRDEIANIVVSLKKQESSRKTSISVLLTIPKPLNVWITTNCGKFFKRWEYQTTWPASWEICMQVKKQQLELDMEQQTDSKSGKEYDKTVYCHPAYLTYIQSTSLETLGWKKHKLESRLPG